MSQKQKYDTMSTEALEEILRADGNSPETYKSDTETLLYIMELLAERKRTSNAEHKVQEAWEDFCQEYLPGAETTAPPEENPTAKPLPYTFFKHTKRILQTAAIVVVAILAVFSLLFVSVEAFRVRVVNFYIEQTDGYFFLTGNPEEHQKNPTTSPITFDIEDPLRGVISDDYTLTVISNADPQRISATYENAAKECAHFLTMPYTASLHVDIEGATVRKELKVLGFDGVLTAKSGIVQIAWCDSTTGTMYLISMMNASEEEVLVLATNFIITIQN